MAGSSELFSPVTVENEPRLKEIIEIVADQSTNEFSLHDSRNAGIQLANDAAIVSGGALEIVRSSLAASKNVSCGFV